MLFEIQLYQVNRALNKGVRASIKVASGMGPGNFVITGLICWEQTLILINICKYPGNVLWRGKDRMLWECADVGFNVHKYLSSVVCPRDRSGCEGH